MSFGSDEKVHAEELAAVLVSWRGIMLGVTLGEKPYGVIQVDFGRDAKVLEGIAKQFLLDALAKHGALIDDLQEWNSLFHYRRPTIWRRGGCDLAGRVHRAGSSFPVGGDGQYAGSVGGC